MREGHVMAALGTVGTRGLAAAACAVLLAAGLPGTVHGTQISPVPPDAESGVTLGSLSLIPWYASPSLVKLRKEVDARWPARSRISDGVIGDARHAARTGSHNPVGASGGPKVGTRGAVHAIDITSSGIDVDAFLSAVVGDPRVWYVIHDRRIWSRTTGWAPRAHTGEPHTTHIHVNLREDSQSVAVAAENDTRSWFDRASTSRAFLASPGKSSLTAAQTRQLQRALITRGYSIPAGPTGTYGAQTTAAVASFQRDQGWRGAQADGIAGPQTLLRLGVAATGSSSGRGTTAVVTTRQPAATEKKAPSAPKPAATAGSWDPGNGRLVYDLQNALIARGYSIPAGPTGHFGTRTKQAVKAFQKSLGFSGSQADGIPGATTLRRLGITTTGSASSRGTAEAVTKPKPKPAAAKKAPSAPKPAATGRSWDPGNGRLVYDLQNALIAQGYSIPAGPTGYFGARTKQAVKEFQESLGFTGAQADGVPGPTTLRRLGL
jgi:peptidoglycan hydrolase-like protein with peptidoglycan-binding domain